MKTQLTDQQLIDRHATIVRLVADRNFGLMREFAESGITPEALLEGSLTASIFCFSVFGKADPADLAGQLEAFAGRLRSEGGAVFAGLIPDPETPARN